MFFSQFPQCKAYNSLLGKRWRERTSSCSHHGKLLSHPCRTLRISDPRNYRFLYMKVTKEVK